MGVEKWILEGWDLLNTEEQTEIEERINLMFKDGFPFELKHERIIYLYIFTLLSQLEVVALQLPLRALPELKDQELKQLMRQQLVDEIFHAMLFSKIAYELSTPYSHLPEYNQCIINVSTFIREEKDLGTAIVLLNLIAEAWFEEFLNILSEHEIAPEVFDVILKDEMRHVQEAQLYENIRLSNLDYIRKQINHLEMELFCDLLFQQKYSLAIVHALGMSGSIELINRIYCKHNEQIEKIGIPQNEKWVQSMNEIRAYFEEIESPEDKLVELSTTRKILLSAWQRPADPTLFSMLSLNVTRLETFENKYPPQTLTGLMLQTMSKLSKDNPSLRSYVSHGKMYQMTDNYIQLVINLPGASNHLAMLKFKDAHEISLYELSERVKNYVEIMSYARYKAEELAAQNPQLLTTCMSKILPDPNDIFKEIMLPQGMLTLTNVGPWGGEQNLSPLLPFEVLKLTMSQVERKQVWNNKSKEFEIQDRLPIGLSADHRVFDANMGTPKMLQITLDEMIDKLEHNAESKPSDAVKEVKIEQFIELSTRALEENLNIGFGFLTTASHSWSSDIDIETLHKKIVQ